MYSILQIVRMREVVMSLFSKKYQYQDKTYYLSLLVIWKKLHVSNEYSKINGTDLSWKISSRFKSLFRLCFVCYGILIALYLVFITSFTIDASGNLFYVFLNLFIIFFPLYLIELGMTYLVPLQVEKIH